MAVLDVCFVAKHGVSPPDNILDALRVPTGATKTVREVYWQMFANPTEAVLTGAREVIEWSDPVYGWVENPDTGIDEWVIVTPAEIIIHQVVFTLAAGEEVTRNLELDHVLSRPADRFPVYNDEGDIINYRLRMVQEVERPVVVGGWKLIPGSQVGDWKLYHVRSNPVNLLRLHEWMTADAENPDAHPAAGALCVRDTSEDAEPRTMEERGVWDRLGLTTQQMLAKRQAIADYCESQTTGSGAFFDTANTEPLILLGWLKAAQPHLTNAQLREEFWKRW